VNAFVIITGFVFGYSFGGMIGRPNAALVAFAGLGLAVLLGNYPYYDVPAVAVTYAAALAGVLVASRRGR